MVSYAPPIDNLPIFDPSVFSSDDDTLTQAQADFRYCLYPNVQGSLNLISASVLGTLDMSNNNITNINQISCDTTNVTDTNITTFNKINQDLLVGTDNSCISGFYSKVRDVFPASDNNVNALKAVTDFTYSSDASVNTFTTQSVIWCPFFRRFFLIMNGSGYTTDDGINFTLNSPGSGTNWVSAVFIPEINRVIAVGITGTYRIRYTDDFVTWNTPASLPPFQQLRGITYSPQLKKLVIVCGDGDQRVWVSYDYGLNWFTRQVPEANIWRNVCWCDTLGLFVACSYSDGTNAFMISKNGDNWFSVSAPADNTNNLRNVGFSKELGIIVGVGTSATDASKRMVYSYDGLNWFTGNITGTNLNTNVGYIGIAWSPQLRVFVATGFATGNITGSKWIYSYDGINWRDTTTSTLGTGDSWLAIDWSPELSIFLAAGGPQSGSTMAIRTMKSSLKARLPTANNLFGHPSNNIDEYGNWKINERNLNVANSFNMASNTTTSLLTATAGGASGSFINVNINNVAYKIRLLNP